MAVFLISDFRASFPEFADDVKYPDSTITFWSKFGDKFLKVTRWADIRTEGLYLWTAHQLVLATISKSASTMGQVPGKSAGVVTSESVGGVSYSADIHSSMELDAGHWNETTYGRQFIRLSRIVGMGGEFV